MRGRSRIGILFIIASLLVIAGVSALSSVTIQSPTPGSNVSGTITLNATTDTNATNVTFYFYDASNGSLAFQTSILNDTANDTVFENTSFDTTAHLDGVYNVTVNATNATVNVINSSLTGLTIDNTGPNVTINAPLMGANLSNATITLNATVTDATTAVDSVTFEVLNGTLFNVTASNPSGDYWNASLDLSTVDEGLLTIRVWANDSLGNANNTENVTITVDRTAPSIALENASFNTTDDTPSVYVNTTDALSSSMMCELLVDATGYGSSSVTNDTSTELVANASLSDGTYVVNVTCSDDAGNTDTSSQINVMIDTTAPTVSFTTPNEGSSSNETNLTLNVSVTGTPASVTYRIVNSSNASQNLTDWTSLTQNGTDWNASINLSNLTEWNYSIEVRANDSLNNTRISNRTFLVDRTAPSASLSCDDVDRNDAQSCTCTATDNSDAFGGTTSTFTTSADTGTTGTKSATCTATDLSGLTGEDSDSFIVSSSESTTGGGGTYTAPDPSAKKSWIVVEPGTRVALTIDDEQIPISRISILVGSSSERASIEVERLDRSPVPVDFDLYEVFDITVLSFKNASERTIEFTVPTAWIRERGLQPSDISLFRHVDGEWIELETRRTSLANDAHRYEAKTPGFSFFAIGTNEVEPSSDDTTLDTAPDAPDTPEQESEPDEQDARPSDQNTTAPDQLEEGSENNAPLVLIIGSIVGVILLAIAAWFIFGRDDDIAIEPRTPRKTPVHDEFTEHSKQQASEIDALLGLGEEPKDEPKSKKPAKTSKKSGSKSDGSKRSSKNDAKSRSSSKKSSSSEKRSKK